MRTFSVTSGDGAHACFCVGPQDGAPCCPCEVRNRGLFVRDGRWIEPARGERDLGAAYDASFFDTSNEPTN